MTRWPDLVGKAAFVTGAGAGIGRAIALALAAEDVAVGLLTRTPAHGEATAEAIEATGGRAVAYSGDVGRAGDVEAAVKHTVAAFGRLDIVVANAGVELAGTVVDTPVAAWERIVATNVSGVFYTCKFTVPHLRPAGGSIVVIGSDAAITGAQGYAAYATTKHALVGLTRCMALDFGAAAIRTNIVCPTFVETEMARRLVPRGSDAERVHLAKIPAGRFAQAEEVADAVCHLASERAAFVNGLVYTLDGGQTAGPLVARR